MQLIKISLSITVVTKQVFKEPLAQREFLQVLCEQRIILASLDDLFCCLALPNGKWQMTDSELLLATVKIINGFTNIINDDDHIIYYNIGMFVYLKSNNNNNNIINSN